MLEIYGVFIGIAILGLSIPIGNLLAKAAKEELKAGRHWFKLLIILSLAGAVVFLVLRKDALFFSLLFIAVVTSRSVKKSER
jgi:hypothetical protein